MKVNLEGRVALVTGAARGIGRAIADALGANGAEVIYSDVDLASAEAAAAAGRAAGGGRGWALRLDVTDEPAVEAALLGLGRLDILVNNAGVNTAKHRVNLDAFPREEWDRIVNVDLTGLYVVSKAAARVMLAEADTRAGESGERKDTPATDAPKRIINIASVAGLVPLRLQCAFVAAKAGVVNLTRAMALELAPRGILVNCIAPGSILTDGTRQLFYGPDGLFSASVQRMLAHVPLGRPGRVEEVAHAALFLASPESSYVNGAVLTVDGGWTAGYLREF